jgi:RimJ/RimL family protein N-acetyltransferase
MPKRPSHDDQVLVDLQAALAGTRETTTVDWRQSPPILIGSMLTLRQLRLSDAQSLLAMVSTDDVSRFISPPPTTIEGIERFIAGTHRERAAGNYVCFGVVPNEIDTAVGIFQVRRLDLEFAIAEWGFAIGSGYWGSGLFVDGAKLVIDFSFNIMGAHRLEARAVVANGRANGALRKVGAVQQSVLRSSFLRNDGEYLDQALWTIAKDDWRTGGSASAQTH